MTDTDNVIAQHIVATPLASYRDHRAAIDDAIRADDALMDELRRRTPARRPDLRAFGFEGPG
jgi:hypothetical protein